MTRPVPATQTSLAGDGIRPARALAVAAVVVMGLTPVSLGGYPEWARGILSVLLLSWLAGMLVIGLVTGRSTLAPILARLWLPAVLFLMLLAWFLVQSLDIGPGGWAHQAWSLLAAPDLAPPTGSISVQPDKTLTRAIGFAAYGAWALLCLRISLHRRAARIVTVGLVYVALIHALFALGWYIFLPDKLLWLDRWLHTNLTGFFFNRNHAACFFGLLLFVVLGELYRWAMADDTPARHGRRRRGLRDTIVVWADALTGYRFVLIATAGLLVICIALTQSRAGFAGIAAGLVVFALLASMGGQGNGDRQTARRRWKTSAIVLGLTALVALLGYGLFSSRFEAEGLESGRWDVYGPIIDAIGDHAWLGDGFGAFEDGFHAYRPDNVHQLFQFAHSDYLEIALEAGIPAALVFGALVCFVGRRILRSPLTQPKAERYRHLVALAVLAQLATHSLAEFNIAIPGLVLPLIWLILRPTGQTQQV